jgi:hypothetical protein
MRSRVERRMEAVADRSKGMEKERQERILRWVAESLSLDLGASLAPCGRSLRRT